MIKIIVTKPFKYVWHSKHKTLYLPGAYPVPFDVAQHAVKHGAAEFDRPKKVE